MPFGDEIAAFFGRYVEAFAREDADAPSALRDEGGLFPPAGNMAAWTAKGFQF